MIKPNWKKHIRAKKIPTEGGKPWVIIDENNYDNCEVFFVDKRVSEEVVRGCVVATRKIKLGAAPYPSLKFAYKPDNTSIIWIRMPLEHVAKSAENYFELLACVLEANGIGFERAINYNVEHI